MKSHDEMRTEAWKTLRQGGWVTRFLVLWLVLLMLFVLVQGCWNQATLAWGIQTWSAFLQAKAKALASGLDFTVPSRAIAFSMTQASAFETFFTCILNGLLSFALASLFLRAAKGEQRDWLAASFGGFKCPLGVAWLYFRYTIQVALWSMLFFVPGLIAIYRYSQCWNLKVEHPDWSAGRCLAESGRIMKGNKWRRFAFDCSYWRPITLVMLGLLGVTVLSVIPIFGRRIDTLLLFLIGLATGWGSIVLAVYMSIGQALFYLDVKGDDGSAL